MAYTESQRVAIRRYCGYPSFGGSAVPAHGYRFFQHYGALEFRMTNGSPEEEAEVLVMLARLAMLEAAVPTASDNLDTASAGPWVHNRHEVRDRLRLYTFHREELCAFFGVPAGPRMPAAGFSWSV